MRILVVKKSIVQKGLKNTKKKMAFRSRIFTAKTNQITG